MSFYSILQKHLDEFDSVYDLFSFGYHFLMKTVGKSDEADFISKYVWTNPKAKKENPNLKELCVFSDKVEKILLKQENDGISFEACLALLGEEVKQKTDSLVAFGVLHLNDAAIPLFLLYAIDRYMEERRERCTEPAPLNKRWDEQYYIYLKEENNLLEGAMKTLKFSKTVNDLAVRNQFRHLLILEKERLPHDANPPTTSILCNCCEALSSRKKNGFKKDVDIVVTPYKEGSVVVGKETLISRCRKNCDAICEKEGCVYLIHMNFSINTVKKGEIVQSIEQF